MNGPGHPSDPSTGGSAPRADETPGLQALAERLRDLARRAGRNRWRGWTEDDLQVVEGAARELAAFEESLAKGMRNAFEIGREYGKKEGVLERLDDEIAAALSRLARNAWGRTDS